MEVRGRSLDLPEGMGVGGQRPGFPWGLRVEGGKEAGFLQGRVGGRGLALPGGDEGWGVGERLGFPLNGGRACRETGRE